MLCTQVAEVKVGVFCWIFLTFLQDCNGAYRSYRSYRSYSYYDYYYSSGTSSYGGVIGGVISGLIFISFAVALCVCCFCRHQRRRTSPVGVRFLNSTTPQQTVITTNTTPGLYPPPYNSQPVSYGFQPAVGQTVDPPPSYNPPNPQHTESAPSYESMFGKNGSEQ
ncbi:uncharacterized protein LOC125683228 [Ostrea edulis]|uniref:uncharacterized protein LOC125683228 n=1 Tax=Ostrea edulis TaxID=37623 RepID=UPI0020940626|nr:uncharacterized protein LOC125683228 [Ostrea edulis]